MLRACVFAFVLAFMPNFLIADELDDQLAKRLVGIVRDPRAALRARVEAAKMLTTLGPRASAVVPDLTAQLERLRGTEHEVLQEEIIAALGEMGSPAKAALPTLANTTGRSVDLDLAVKGASKKLIGADDSRDFAILVQQLSSRDAGVRLRAVKSLKNLKGIEALAAPYLTAMLTDPDVDVRRAVVQAIREMQPNAKPTKELLAAIVADLSDANEDVRLLAVRILGRYGAAAASVASALEPLLNDSDRDVRKAAADALLRMSSP